MRKWRDAKGEAVPEMMERAALETEIGGGRRRSRRRGRGAAREDGEEEEEEEEATMTMTTMTHELDVEERYNASEARCANAGLVDDGSMMMVRLLDDFEVTRVDEPTKTTRRVKFRESVFADARARSSIVVTGRLKAFGDDTDTDADAPGLTPRVATACDDDVEIELRDVLACRCTFTAPKTDARGFYVVTETAMYKLSRPKSTYAMLYDASFQIRFPWRGARRATQDDREGRARDVRFRLGRLAWRQPADATALQRATEPDDDGETWTSYTERDVLACKETLRDMCLREMVHLRRRRRNSSRR